MKTEKTEKTVEPIKDGSTQEKTERMPSAAYTIKSLGGNIQKIEKLKLANKEDVKTLKEIYEKIVKQYMGYMLEL